MRSPVPFLFSGKERGKEMREGRKQREPEREENIEKARKREEKKSFPQIAR